MKDLDLNNISLIMSSSLVILTILISYWQKLKLEKDVIISVLRATIQLIIVGMVLDFIFGYDNPIFTSLLLLFMTFNAAYNASKRGASIENKFPISFVSIILGLIITLSILLLSGTIKYRPQEIIPIAGMILGNSMVATGLCYNSLLQKFKDKKEEVETKLSLGADIKLSSINIIRDSIKTGMIPSIDSAKTLGIVTLPGMMSGLILAGVNPSQAIKYQLMVTFMLLATTSITSICVCYLSYKYFFNKRKQFVGIKN